MRRGLLVLLAAILIGSGSALLTRHLLEPTPLEWLCRKYGVSPGESGRIASLQKEYCSRCDPYCGRLCEANARLERMALEEGLSRLSVTPKLREAVAETDRIRTEARITMLEHFYAVAEELPPGKRKDYLLKVLPLVLDSCGSR
jgi:hypothetical protein